MRRGQPHGAQILTIEGMAEDPIGRHVVEAFAEGGAVQCGFCTPGFVLSARALLAENPAPAVEEIRQALAGNLCRCTGYKKIVEAIAAAGERVASEQLEVGRGEAGQRPVHTAGFVRPESVMLASRTAGYLMGGPLMEERILEAGEIAAQECQPIDDVRGSAVYRRRLVRGLLVRGLWPYKENG